MVSIPEDTFVYALRGRQIIPRLLGPGDHPWLAALIEAHQRSVGARRSLLEERLEAAGQGAAPHGSVRMARAVLLGMTQTQTEAALEPEAARAELFARHGPPFDRAAIVSATAARLAIAAGALEASLFADLPGERTVLGLTRSLTPAELALSVNLAFCQSLLFRASEVRLRIEGQARAVVRQARLGGLITTVRAPAGATELATLEVSGPLSIFHRTLLYGRALARLLPILAWARRFELEAELTLGGRALVFPLASPAPIFPSVEPRTFDSKLEARFARAFARAAPDWELIREPEPVPLTPPQLLFPDFLVRHRLDPRRHVWIELVGFWTPEYLEKKLAGLEAARLTRLVLCVDEALACRDDRLPSSAAVVRFRDGRIDAEAVLRAVEALSRGPAPG